MSFFERLLSRHLGKFYTCMIRHQKLGITATIYTILHMYTPYVLSLEDNTWDKDMAKSIVQHYVSVINTPYFSELGLSEGLKSLCCKLYVIKDNMLSEKAKNDVLILYGNIMRCYRLCLECNEYDNLIKS